MNWSVTTYKQDQDKDCRLEKKKQAFRCGHCERGLVVRFNPDGSVSTTGRCRVCKAEVRWRYYQV